MRSLLVRHPLARWPELEDGLRARGHEVSVQEESERALLGFRGEAAQAGDGSDLVEPFHGRFLL